jgi:DNA-binding Xre family transcriptional regulator
MKQLQFRIKELMAERERKTGENVTYAIINEVTGVSPNTLSTMARGKVKMVGVGTIEKLLDYFGCQPNDLMVFECMGGE